MVDLKHVGRVRATGKKCLVAFRTLPGDSSSCLIIPTENLPESYHDSLIQLVESASGQSCYEFAEVLARSKFSDGSTMLPALHAGGRLVKVATDKIEMTPNFTSSVLLSELNAIIAQQRNVAIDDLAVTEPVKDNVEVVEVAKINDLSPEARTTSASVNGEPDAAPSTFETPESEAKLYRSQADKLAKQAAEFRRKAEELNPTKRK